MKKPVHDQVKIHLLGTEKQVTNCMEFVKNGLRCYKQFAICAFAVQSGVECLMFI